MGTAAVYDEIGIGYDESRQADPHIVERFVEHLGTSAETCTLEIGCGTGNYTRALSERGIDICGIDASQVMFDEAQQKAPHIDWRLADAASLPFEDASFDSALCMNTIHHWADRPAAFGEALRVLRVGGRLVIFSSLPEQMTHYWLNAYFPVMMYRSGRVMPSLDEITGTLANAGFASIRTFSYSVSPDLRDLFLYAGKHRPVLYFDPRFRAGISSFSQWSEAGEVQRGCAALLDDLHSGRFEEVAAQYDDADGDYMFIVAEKAA